MNKKTMKKFSLSVLPLLALVALSSGAVFAAEDQKQNTEPKTRVEITEAQKQVLMQIKTLHQEGKIDEAKELAKTSGLQKIVKSFRGGHKDHRWPNHENRKKVSEALKNNDFATFKTLTVNTPFAATLTEDIFAQLVRAKTLRDSGDKEGARKIMENLGFKGGKNAPEKNQ